MKEPLNPQGVADIGRCPTTHSAGRYRYSPANGRMKII
jgi:hypothetical protein